MHATRAVVPGWKNCAEGLDANVSRPQPNSPVSLEMEAQLTSQRSWRHVMRPAKR
jgi:hypothetical protein